VGVFRSSNIPYNSEDDKAIKKVNEQVLKGFGLKYGAAHTEFIKNSEDGEIYFLETSSRVGGASAEMVEAASNINLERMGRNRRRVGERKKYSLPKVKAYAGIVLTLSKYQNPDLSSSLIRKFVLKSIRPSCCWLSSEIRQNERVLELLNDYVDRLVADYAVVVKQEKLSKLH
jgi:hypothetical protein